MSADLNIKMTVRNAHLLRAIRGESGTTAEFCRAFGLNPSGVSALITMRASPFREDGSLTTLAEDIVSALGIPADDLWPRQIARLKAKRATVEVEMSTQEFAAISNDTPERQAIYQNAVEKWTERLNDRERLALKVHVEGGTLSDIGAALNGRSRERARQILSKAERKVREAARREGVRVWSDIAS